MVVCMDDCGGMWIFDDYFFCRASQPLQEEDVRMNGLYGCMRGWMGAWVAGCRQVEVKVEVTRHRRMHVRAYVNNMMIKHSGADRIGFV